MIFPDPENEYLHTKIVILSALEAEILEIYLYLILYCYIHNYKITWDPTLIFGDDVAKMVNLKW